MLLLTLTSSAVTGEPLISANTSPQNRWYTQSLVDKGDTVFQLHCAVCHGSTAASTPLWKKTGPDGKFPPPPLDGTAHAWHHPLPMLRDIIKKGGIGMGGSMPSFENSLSDDQIDAVIAWFQSWWPDLIYTRWRGAGDIKVPLPPILENLQKQSVR